MQDIAPQLRESILMDFEKLVEEDNRIKHILTGKGSFEDVSRLSAQLGRYASKALKKNLTDETLPDGILYWNIAKETIIPLMQEVQSISLDMAEAIQKREDQKTGINIKPVRPKFNRERVEAVMNKVVTLSEVAELE